MFLALRELRHSWLRFTLIGAVMALIAWLVFLLTGLANGLATDNAGAMVNLHADYVVYAADAELAPHRSLLSMDTLNTVAALDGVQAVAPLGHMTVTITQLDGGDNIDMTILATPPDGILAPDIAEGRMYQPDTNEVVMDISAKDEGIKLGEEVQVLLSDQMLEVVGFTKGQTYSHLPVIFATIPIWQGLKFPTEAARAGYHDPISLVGVDMNKKTAEKVAAALKGQAEVLSKKEAIQTVPGFTEESGTINMIQVFLLVIAALIMTVFFYVLTMQKTSQFGILKAIGANSAYLARDLVAQVVVLSILGIVVGALLTFTVAAVIPNRVPFDLESQTLLTHGLILFVVAMLGTQLSLWSISRIDPLIAIGRDD